MISDVSSRLALHAILRRPQLGLISAFIGPGAPNRRKGDSQHIEALLHSACADVLRGAGLSGMRPHAFRASACLTITYRHMPACMPSRHIAKLKARLDSAVPGSVDFEERLMLLNCATAANNLQLHLLKAERWNDMMLDLDILENAGYDIPMSHQRKLTSIRSEVYLKKGDFEAWIRCVWPTWTNLHTEMDKLRWQHQSPCLASCCTDTSGEIGDTSALTTAFHQSVLNDAWMAIFRDASRDEKSEPLVACCTVFLETAEKYTDNIPTCLLTDMQRMVQFYKGILALVSPIPGYMGSTLDDVLWCRPPVAKRPTDCAEKALGRVGKIVAGVLRSEKMWTSRYDLLQQHLGADAEHGDNMNKLLEEAKLVLALLLKQPGADDSICKQISELFKRLRLNLATWQASLRPGATSALQRLVFDILTKQWTSITSGNAGGGQTLPTSELKETLECMDIQSARDLAHQVMEHSMATEKSDLLQKLEGCCKGPLSTLAFRGGRLQHSGAHSGLGQKFARQSD